MCNANAAVMEFSCVNGGMCMQQQPNVVHEVYTVNQIKDADLAMQVRTVPLVEKCVEGAEME